MEGVKRKGGARMEGEGKGVMKERRGRFLLISSVSKAA